MVTSTGILRGVNGGGLEIKGIKKEYGDLEAVRDLSFAVLAARICSNSALRIGSRVKLAEAWRVRT